MIYLEPRFERMERNSSITLGTEFWKWGNTQLNSIGMDEEKRLYKYLKSTSIINSFH